MSMSVFLFFCLSVYGLSARITRKPRGRTSPFLCILTVARFSSDGAAIFYVLPVLRMTSSFIPWDQWADGHDKCGSLGGGPVGAAAAWKRTSAARWLGGQAFWACWGGRDASAGPSTPVTALAVRRLDSAAAGDGGARFAVCITAS